ncbi:alpha/beta hydrolase [Aurantibacter crassamenti]|uniref:alpha/beta fold hydrolase n=1 Tax=Aurantibacter crassamenti TaxID=1837375 RepID=UPI0019394596|nr:alpha/beta hydrolase [Aurantibacter crassamenti]MBM1106165.1 alpha/beta hydrolase [Aurantibacter crassamenti]
MKKTLNRILPKAYGYYFNFLALISSETAAKKAFKLFCTPRKGRVLAHQKNFLDSAKSEIIEADSVQFQTYHWEGKKETVLLLHGWESNSFRWRNLISILQKEDFNIIAVDAPAHGYSTSKTFTAVLYATGITPIVEKYKPKHILAHSIGGMSALYYHSQADENGIEKIVTLGSPSEFSPFIKGYQDFLGLNSRVMKAMDKHFFNLFGFHMNEFSTAKFANNFKIKGLLIHDIQDKVTAVSGSEKVHESWKNSTLIKTTGLGHSLHQDEVSDKIIAFLKS